MEQEKVLMRAPPGYTYQTPSGAKSKLFLKPDVALDSSEKVAFVALSIHSKIPTSTLKAASELDTLFVDTMSIAPVAFALRQLLLETHPDLPLHVESFHSYQGIDEVGRPAQGTSYCLISASVSMELPKKWVEDKGVSREDVLTILSSRATKTDLPILCRIECEEGANGRQDAQAQLSIRIHGETFLPESEPPKSVLLREADHGCALDLQRIEALKGRGVFDSFRQSPFEGSTVRAIFVDGDALVDDVDFNNWLDQELLRSLRASTAAIVYQDDGPSKKLGELIKKHAEIINGGRSVALVRATDLATHPVAESDAVVICAAVIGSGSQLLQISRALRDKHEGHRLYVVGFQCCEVRADWKSIETNLQHAKWGKHQLLRFGHIAIGIALEAALRSERATFGSAAQAAGIPSVIAQRYARLGGADPVKDIVFWPSAEGLVPLRIRPGFAYWKEVYDASKDLTAEVLVTVAIILQRARELDVLPERARLGTRSFRQVVLNPESFARFNDGILQASLLRCCFPSELDYRSDTSASNFMRALIVGLIDRVGAAGGEGLFEFLLALSLGRLRLEEDDLRAVVNAAQACDCAEEIRQCIEFLIGPLLGTPVADPRPF
jgi:hypothetical protein